MKVLSWSIRGLGIRDQVKRVLIKETLLEISPDVVLWQETKVESFDLLLRSI